MTNIIGFGRTQLNLQPETQARSASLDKSPGQTLQADKLAISDEASVRLQGLPSVDAPQVTNMTDAMKMARNTVQMFLERPDQARVSHVPDLGARVAGLMA